jgi:structural toxin protein (hemagglutinin/hemolysin) RtxA
MYQIIFYAPPSHVEQIKNAMFACGAGKIGTYSCCAWQTKGEGQFMPLSGSHAFIGTTNQLEKVEEYKVEMICEKQYIDTVISALKKFHPYEEPAYFITRMENIE